MLKFMVMFRPQQTALDIDEAVNAFITQLAQIPDVQRQQVVIPLGSPIGTMPYVRIIELYFNTQTQMMEALRTPEGQAAGQLLTGFAPNSYDIVFAEVYEERK
jgi:hypothetical protein